MKRIPRAIAEVCSLGFAAVAFAQEPPRLSLEELAVGEGVAPGLAPVDVARVSVAEGAVPALTIRSSHAECRFEQRRSGDSAVNITLAYSQDRRVLGNCMLSVEAAGRPETRLVATVPLRNPTGLDTVEVRFTNPDCPARPYAGYFEPSKRISAHETYSPLAFLSDDRGIPLRNGQWRATTRPGTYCLGEDTQRSRERPGTPSEKLLGWIADSGQGSRIFFSSYTFTDRSLRNALCDASKRGALVEFVLGSPSEQANSLVSECGARAFSAGDVGEDGDSRLNHAKFFIIEKEGSPTTRIVFQSANVSTSGLTIHHENWGFAEKRTDTRFVQDHFCYRDALKSSHFNVAGSNAFKANLERCRSAVRETDDGMEVFLIPGQRGRRQEGDLLNEAILRELAASESVDVAAHHFLQTSRNAPTPQNDLLSALQARLKSDRRFRMRLVLDHELFWVGNAQSPDATGVFPYDHYPATARLRAGEEGRGADFAGSEYAVIRKFIGLGAQVRFVETNFLGSRFQHNKFLVFHRGDGKTSVFSGAGNFSSAAFHRNGETFYFIRDSRLTDSWTFQFDHLWNDLATTPSDMPVTWAVQVSGSPEWATWRPAIEAKKVREERSEP